MANNNQQMVFSINGNSTGLQNALQTASQSLLQFGQQAGGQLAEASEGFESLFKRVTGLSGGLVGFAAGAGIALSTVGVAFEKVGEQAEKAFEVIQSASLSQTSITQVQQMAAMYSQVGLNLEQLSDQTKDIKDRLGDALTNVAGSMYTDVIQPLHLSVLELQKMADAGQDVYAKIYFAAKQQGYSTSQLVNMFETMGNDAAKRLTVLRQFNNEQDYNNTLSQQTVSLTQQQADQFQSYTTAQQELGRAWDKWNNETLAPVAARLAEILELMSKILNSKPVSAAANATGQQGIDQVAEYSQNFSQQNIANSSIFGQMYVQPQIDQTKKNQQGVKQLLDNAVQLQQTMDSLIKESNQGVNIGAINAATQPFMTTYETAQKKITLLDSQYTQVRKAISDSLIQAYKGDVKAQSDALAKLDTEYQAKRKELIDARDKPAQEAAKQAAAQAKAAADKAAQQQKEANAKRLQAEINLQKALSSIGDSQGQIRIQEFNRQQDAIVKTIRDTSSTLKLSASQTTKYLQDEYASRTQKYKEMVDDMIGYSDPNKSLRDLNSNITAINQNGGMSKDQQQYILDQQAQRLSIPGQGNNASNPWGNQNILNQNTKDIQAGGQQELDLNQKMYDAQAESYEEFQKRKQDITVATNKKIQDLTTQNTTAQMNIMSDAAGNISTIMAGVFGKSSGIAKTFAAVQKGIAIGQIMTNISVALSEALATPFPASLAAYAQVLSLGASIISTAKGGSSSGQFHGGVDSLDSQYDNKSFVLKAGERVVQPEANKKLTSFLDSQDSNSTQQSGTVINAPLIVQGGSTGIDDKTFQKMLDKHKINVAMAVKQSQTRTQ